MNNYKNKKVLITGGTGSFGKTFAEYLITTDVDEIVIFSRDEAKQDLLRYEIVDKRLTYVLGDIRDYSSINKSLRNIDYVFHAAALKQVPSSEIHPLEAVKTNILGSKNVIESAIDNSVEKVICLSTDKSVAPVNAMGMTKALMEKVAQSYSHASDTTICCTRYGNVIASRGSVVPLFIKQIRENKALTITNPSMTRFLMTLEDAIDLVNFAFDNGSSGEIFVRKSPSASVKTIANAVIEVMKAKEDYSKVIIGDRPAEKIHETLLSFEESVYAEDLEGYFKIKPATVDCELNAEKYEFSSNSNKLLTTKEVVDLLTLAKINIV